MFALGVTAQDRHAVLLFILYKKKDQIHWVVFLHLCMMIAFYSGYYTYNIIIVNIIRSELCSLRDLFCLFFYLNFMYSNQEKLKRYDIHMCKEKQLQYLDMENNY